MSPDAYLHVFLASVAGGITGALVMWSRKHAQALAGSRLRRFAVLMAGSAASVCALVSFTKALGGFPSPYAVVVVITLTSWAAVVQSAVQLPLPGFVMRVRDGEHAFLRARWTGVRLFGAVLRHTPLRHLGGPVYLAATPQDPGVVIRGLRDAEAVHVWAVAVSLPWFVLWMVQGYWVPMAWGLAIHLPLNVYPILHVRYALWRVERLRARRRRY